MYTLNDLCDKAFNELIESGLSYKTVYGANWYIWNRLVRKYGGEIEFEESMVKEYCLEYFGRDIFSISKSKLLQVESRYITSFNNLIQSSRNIPFAPIEFHYHRDYKLDEKSINLLNEYLEFSKNNGNSEKTLRNKELRIRNFMIDCDFENISKNKILDYLNKRRSVMADVSYTIEIRLIKRFLVFCYEKGSIDKEILLAFPDKMVSTDGKNIPSAYSIEEIKDLLSTAKTYTREDDHLRNYAILSLIVFSGIRANDVVNLKFENISWLNNEIKFTQQKTKREHVIPLIPEIGNPLVEYILKERKSDEQFIFVSEKGKQLNSNRITNIISTYFSNSNIEINGRQKKKHYGKVIMIS